MSLFDCFKTVRLHVRQDCEEPDLNCSVTLCESSCEFACRYEKKEGFPNVAFISVRVATRTICFGRGLIA